VSDQAYFDILLGRQEPKGLLPMQFPKDMSAVEAQKEDVGQDLTPYTDTMGNAYDFGYGLNYKGVISDARTKRYAGH
jgi:beta-glucosidase